MSHPLVSHSPDLQRLRDDGFDFDVVANYLQVRHVPYAHVWAVELPSGWLFDGALDGFLIGKLLIGPHQ